MTSLKINDDLIAGYELSGVDSSVILVIAGRGPQEHALREIAERSLVAHRIRFLNDVGDAEKPSLMAGCAAFALPGRPPARVCGDLR
ncbi:hypothetical protein JF66_05250 [Cryobacterium sp. MLB-32]|uniref:hypothetical protein n=1 Tax=Cryobacterium sp. MLB-32 TaxID=1529318 RepID=UPI0004E7420B|nr:hypothetical protein [Cryobacterium sp. MLB-32]KFF60346.1 hypothetical protein JF66_05250 [Cryobacterium sp. MLB-32]